MEPTKQVWNGLKFEGRASKLEREREEKKRERESAAIWVHLGGLYLICLVGPVGETPHVQLAGSQAFYGHGTLALCVECLYAHVDMSCRHKGIWAGANTEVLLAHVGPPLSQGSLQPLCC